jgi:hypothetical protein
MNRRLARRCHTAFGASLPCACGLVAVSCLAWFAWPANMVAQSRGFTVRVDSRVELLSIVFRLAGAPEYNACRLPSYEADIDQAFHRYKEHAAVQLARQIGEQHGVGFDAVVSFAVSVTDPPALGERVPFGRQGTGLADSRWHGPHAAAFLSALRRFSSDAKFPEFFAHHRLLYSETERRLETLARERVSLQWYDGFFGHVPDADFVLVPGMCNGGANFGPKVHPKGGREELYAIVGVTQSDAEGVPTFEPWLVPTIVHEFAHSFINPFVDRHRQEFAPAGERLFPYVADIMQGQAYDNWKTMIDESLVRAVVIRYLRTNGEPGSVSRQLAEELGLGFLWIEELDRLLQRYEDERDKFVRFDQFAPQVVGFFDEVSRSIQDRLKGLDARRPAIVSITPPDGATGVDPSINSIVIVFDRPMGARYSFDVGPGGKSTYPDITKLGFEGDQKTFVMQVRLQPSTAYELLLTGTGFRSREGIPPSQRLIRFQTGPVRQ